MNENFFFFVVCPYAALALVVVGTAVRYVLARRRPDLLRAQMREAKSVFTGRIFWLSLGGLMVAHGVGLVLPHAVLSWNSSPARLYLSEGLALALGLAALATGSHMVWKHLERQGGGLFDEVCDTVFLALLFVVTVSGLLVAVVYRWGSSWGVMTLTPYAVSLLRGVPAVNFIKEMPFLVQLHVLSTFAAVAVIPLTRLSSLMVSVVEVALDLVARPFSAAQDRVEVWIQKHNPSAWFWPDED
jgi:nitrate reductase gamma subunit